MAPFPADAALHQLIFAPCQNNAAPRPPCPPTNHTHKSAFAASLFMTFKDISAFNFPDFSGLCQQ
jgi:hypothetical protein